MYKVLFSDFEDVLIDHEDAIPLSTMLALDKIRSKKVAFGVLSNKGFQTVLDYNKDFPFMDYICIYDGAYLYDVNRKKAIVDQKISLTTTKKINKICSSYNICFYTLDYCNCTKELLNQENSRLIGDFKVFSEFHKDSIYKIEIVCPKKEQEAILEELNKIKEVSIHTNKNIIVIQKSGSNIISCFDQFCEAKKLKMNQFAILGKDERNIDLFKSDAFGIAVEDASLKIRRASDTVTVPSTDHPVEAIISEYF
ncbi:MAG: HAD hydrolase family protein [Bacilli bacterium]|nr:HAD hydrolase family protein [Bacilli bacterium]